MNNEITEELLGNKKHPPKRTNKKIIIIAAVIGILLILLAVALYFLFRTNPQEEYKKSMDLGKKYLEEGDYENAILSFNEAISIVDNEPEAYTYLAQSAVLGEEYETAHTAYDKLIEISDDKVEPTIGKADVYVAEGKYAEAESLLESLSVEYPDNERVQYALNSYNEGNLPNNIINGGQFVYDSLGNLYFVNDIRSDSASGVSSKTKIISYNPSTNETKVIVEEDGLNTGIGTLNIWNNQLYFNEGNSIVRINLDGSDRKVISVDYNARYICDGKIYATDGLSSQYNKSANFITLTLDGALDEVYQTGITSDQMISPDSWLVKNGKIYYIIFVNNSTQIRLYEYNTETKTNTELATVGTQTDYDIINGIYICDNTIYYSLGQEELIFVYNLDTKENKPLKITGKEFGFAVNDKYIILGSKDGNIFNVLDRETLQQVTTINDSFINDQNEHFPAQTLQATGVCLTPTSIVFNREFVFSKSGGGSNYTYYNNCYQIDFDSWEGKEIYQGL